MDTLYSAIWRKIQEKTIRDFIYTWRNCWNNQITISLDVTEYALIGNNIGKSALPGLKIKFTEIMQLFKLKAN